MAEGTRLAPTPIPGDAILQLCLVAQELQKNQRELPLLRDAVATNTETMDLLLARLTDLVAEMKALRASIDENTAAVGSGGQKLQDHADALAAHVRAFRNPKLAD